MEEDTQEGSEIWKKILKKEVRYGRARNALFERIFKMYQFKTSFESHFRPVILPYHTV